MEGCWASNPCSAGSSPARLSTHRFCFCLTRFMVGELRGVPLPARDGAGRGGGVPNGDFLVAIIVSSVAAWEPVVSVAAIATG